MKKISVLLSVVCIVISIQNVKSQNFRLFRSNNTHKSEVIPERQATDSIVKVDNLKLFITKEIIPFYNGNFDILIKITSLELLQRDKNILRTTTNNDSVLYMKICELEEYHKAKSLLSLKYDSLVVNKTIKFLRNKPFPSTETDRLISLLENYGFIKKDLVTLIQEIDQRKKKPDTQDFVTRAKINERVFKFLYPDDNNNANMSNYQLVLHICNCILKSKREDLDGDILYLLKEI